MLTAHDTRFILGNETIARWLKRTPHDNPHVLAHILTNDLAGPGRWRAPPKPRRSYAEATRIEGMTEGGKLFMTRCSACHTVGGGDTKLGPDLAGVVERRPRAWLHRWIKEPDRMIAEKDPAVTAMVAPVSRPRDAQSQAQQCRRRRRSSIISATRPSATAPAWPSTGRAWPERITTEAMKQQWRLHERRRDCSTRGGGSRRHFAAIGFQAQRRSTLDELVRLTQVIQRLSEGVWL